MKKAFCIVIIITTLFLASCAGDAPIVNSTPTATVATVGTSGATTETPSGTTAAASESTTATTAATSTTPAAAVTPKVYGEKLNNGKYYFRRNETVETRSKLILMDGPVYTSTVYYYSKADGEFYPFCFDPFCEHKDENKCLGALLHDPFRAVYMSSSDTKDPRRVYYINGRLYFVAHKKIYSCSELATDLRVELNINANIQTFENDGDYLLFICADPDGTIVQYAYDTVSKKLIDMKKKITEKEKNIGATLYTFSYESGKIYMAAYSNVTQSSVSSGLYIYVEGDFKGWYVADYEFKSFSETDYVPTLNYEFTTNYGRVEILRKNDDGTLVDIVHRRYDGMVEMIAENYLFEKMPISLYMTDDSYYFWYFDPIDIGIDPKYNSGKTQRPNSYGGKIRRLDLKTGEIQTVFDDLAYDAFNIFYLDEDSRYGFMELQKYTVENGMVSSQGGILYQFKLDENGNFIDLERVVLE